VNTIWIVAVSTYGQMCGRSDFESERRALEHVAKLRGLGYDTVTIHLWKQTTEEIDLRTPNPSEVTR
jgi:hypothetical protein